MKTLHTAGPWTYAASGHIDVPDDWSLGERVHAGGKVIAVTIDGNSTDPLSIPLAEAEANARLIASAPELLEALQDMCNAYAGTGEQSSAEKSQQAYHRALMLVTKATGGNL